MQPTILLQHHCPGVGVETRAGTALGESGHLRSPDPLPPSLSVCAQSCPTLCDSMDCSAPGSSVHGILQARTPEWVAMPSSRGSSWPRDWTCVSGYLLHWQAGSLLMHHLGNLSPHSTQRDYKHEWWRFIFLKITHQQSSSRDFCPVWRECILELTVEPSFPLISLSP